MPISVRTVFVLLSLSARRAWIEIPCGAILSLWVYVALRKESVDRNLWWGVRKAVGSLVALRKESVDRNLSSMSVAIDIISSLSARRAWIEIKSSIEEVSKYVGRSPQGERG